MNTGPPAKVTGISPNEGVPGTKLTLRGEHFGKSALDLTHVFVGGIDVSPSARWFSDKRLSVITPLGTGELEIVIVTKSGGIGTAELTYNQNVAQKIGAQEQVSYWPEEERRRCPAIIERGSGGTRPEGGGDVADASLLFSATGIPVAELSRFGIPLSDSTLAKIYPSSGSVQLSEPEFDPMLFLLKFYKNASFQDLVMARNNFSQSITASGEHESSSVIKNNLYLIFRCLEGMEDLKEQMNITHQDGEAKQRDSQSLIPRPPRRFKKQEGTTEMRLEKKLADALDQGNDIFKDVLGCRKKADSARNVLNIMQRFHFLFLLPETIRTNIKQGEYNLAINDYKRAKTLFSSSDVEAFQREDDPRLAIVLDDRRLTFAFLLDNIYSEVESVVAQFRDSLKKELLQVPIDVDEALKRIKCLQQLNLDYDPCWLCLEAFKAWLIDQLTTYQSNYQENLKVSNLDETITVLPVTRSPKNKKALIIQLVQMICGLLSTHFVQFWRLQAVCLVASKENPSNVQESQQASEERYQALNVELIHLLASCVREVVLEPGGVGTPENISSGWAATCIQEFRNCCLSLPLDIVPKDAQVVLRRLSYDLRRHAIHDILHSSQTSIESLYFKENWEVEVNDEGGSITRLPLAYETLVLESLSRCRTLMSPRTSLENSLFDSAEYQERFSQTFAESMLGFLTTLQRLADQIDASLPRTGQFNSDQASEHSTCQGAVVAQSRGLLLLVSNADWAARRVNTRVFNSYSTAGYSNVTGLRNTVVSAWKIATDALVERYTRIRVWWLCSPLDRQHVDSNSSPSIVMSAVCNLSHIHAELVLLLGLPPVNTSRRVSSPTSPTDVGSVPNISSPGSITADEVALPSYYRIAPILKTIIIKLSDIIQRNANDKSANKGDIEEQVSFILKLLQSLISGNPLHAMIGSTSNERDSTDTLETVKRSLRLVASALDSSIFSSDPQTPNRPQQPPPSSRRIFSRPHLRPRT